MIRHLRLLLLVAVPLLACGPGASSIKVTVRAGAPLRNLTALAISLRLGEVQSQGVRFTPALPFDLAIDETRSFVLRLEAARSGEASLRVEALGADGVSVLAGGATSVVVRPSQLATAAIVLLPIAIDCQSVANCPPAAPICDAQKKQCRACQAAADDPDCKLGHPATPLCQVATGACVACRQDQDCRESDRPICDNGACVGCREAKDCATDQRPICDPSSRLCRPCADGGDDDACKLRDGSKPFCLPGGGCGECRASGDCRDPAKRACSGNRCVAQCETDNDCAGKGQMPRCCDQACVDLADNKDHCGGCGKRCNKTCCAARCVDLESDDQNCGKCGVACSPADHCCASACRDLDIDAGHCGACGKACAVGQPCCGASCRDINVDNNHCGGCSKVCMPANATPACGAGKCAYSACAMGFGDCDQNAETGCEANLGTDLMNCTACGKACAPANAMGECRGGCTIKACNVGFGDCDRMAGNGCEVSLTTDADHCKVCGAKCVLANAKAGCSGGNCTVAACDAGFGDCDATAANGCETNTASDASHCGGCGKKCNFGVLCVNGVCTPDKVLIIGTNDLHSDDVAKKLMATGSFLAVDKAAAQSSTPSTNDMKPFQAVLVFSSGPFKDAAALGDNLANYVDLGGRVVVAAQAINNRDLISGRFRAEYLLIEPDPEESAANDSLGTVVDRNPLLTGVNTLATASMLRTAAPLAMENGSRKMITVAAFWKNGMPRPLVVRGVVRGKPRVDLNFFPPSNDVAPGSWTGDGAVLLRNALVYR